MLVLLAVLGAGFVVVMALGRFARPGATSDPEQPDDDDTGQSTQEGSSGADSVHDDGVLARRWKRGEVPLVRGLVEPAQNLPPVLLPDDPVSDDVDRLRFSAGLRGYRMDQVDEVLDLLRDSLAAKDQRLAELEAAVAELEPDPGVAELKSERPAADPDPPRRDGRSASRNDPTP
ncbi:DivIVA domain-containing protein [Arthrobacter pigmenti]